MREYAKISPKFWINLQGREIKKLGIEAQLISLYLITNPHSNMIGIYYLSLISISHETGITLEKVTEVINDLSNIKFCSYDTKFEYIWIHDMALDQIGANLKFSDNRVKSINEIYTTLPPLSFLNDFFNKYAIHFFLKNREEISGFEGNAKGLLSQEKEKEQEHEHEQKEKDMRLNTEDNLKKQAIEVLEFLNQKTGRGYRPVDGNLKLIIARLKSGASLMDCRQVIAKKNREWRGDPKMAEYLRPATLFNAIKFEQYVGELVVPEEENKHV